MVGIWSKFGQGRKLVKNVKILKVLRMDLPIVENLSGLQESIFSLSRGPQLHFGEKAKKMSNFIKFIDFPLFPLFGVPWAAVIFGANGSKCTQQSARVAQGGQNDSQPTRIWAVYGRWAPESHSHSHTEKHVWHVA